MKKIFVSIVSHNHDRLIKKINSIVELCSRHGVTVVIKSNTSQDDFSDYKALEGFHWLNSNYGMGFGANNNFIFKYCCDVLDMRAGDYFIVLNPDVEIKSVMVSKLVTQMENDNCNFAAINLYKDLEYREYDNSIRRFPSLFQFFKSFSGLGNDTLVDKSLINEPSFVEWAAGSFLAFSVKHYRDLGGFDERYFMYCEDIDICYRSVSLKVQLKFFPEIRAIHYARHENRNFFSFHFIWHVKSVFRFVFSRLGLTKPMTSI